jgi:hypothetical protein
MDTSHLRPIWHKAFALPLRQRRHFEAKLIQLFRKPVTRRFRTKSTTESRRVRQPESLRRKALVRRLAEHGGTSKQLQWILGHGTLKEVERYTHAADRRKLSKAAMRKLKNSLRPSFSDHLFRNPLI